MLDDFSQLPRVDENQRRKLGIGNASNIFAPWERPGKKNTTAMPGRTWSHWTNTCLLRTRYR